MRANKDSPFNALKDLRKQLEQEQKAKEENARKEQALARKKVVAKQAQLSEEELFKTAMSGVKPIDRESPKPKAKPTSAYGQDEDAEVLQTLQDLVNGKAPLDFTFSDEHVEGRAHDCSHLEVSKLRNGDYAVQAHLDLHGKTRDEARLALEEFFTDSMKKSYRCVLVISGRGLRSPGGKPVLKQLLMRWLVQGTLSSYVLAFCSAKAHDGGVGAIYVLLRRRRTVRGG